MGKRGRKTLTDADGLTATQRALYRYLWLTFAEEQRMPSLKEMAAAVGIGGLGSCCHHLDRLESAGLISREGFAARSLRLCAVTVRLELDISYTAAMARRILAEDTHADAHPDCVPV